MLRQLSLSVLLLLAAPAFAGEVIEKPKLNLKFTLPDGFVANETVAKSAPGVESAYIRPVPVGLPPQVISISPMGGVVGREKPILPPGVKATTSMTKWKSFDLMVVRIVEPSPLGEIVTYNVQVPLKPEAVQLSFIGLAADDEQIKALLHETIATVKGPSNWDDPPAGERELRGLTQHLPPAARLGLAGVLIVMGLAALVYLRPRMIKGGVLGISAAFWMSTTTPAMNAAGSTDMLLLVGVIRLTATGGVLLGLADLFIPREETPPAEAILVPEGAPPNEPPALPPVRSAAEGPSPPTG